MFPTGAPLFVRLKMFVAFTEKLSAYGRCTGDFAGGLASPPLAGVVLGPPGGGAFGSIALPNLKDLPTFIFNET